MFGSDGVAATNCRQPGSVVSWITGPGRLRRAARSPPFLCLAERVEDRHRDDRRLPGIPGIPGIPGRRLLLARVSDASGSGSGFAWLAAGFTALVRAATRRSCLLSSGPGVPVPAGP